MAPRRTWPAISRMRGVPSSALSMERKKNHAMHRATTEAMGTSQKANGMFMMFCYDF